MKIVIDARESGTTSGRYVDKLLEYLQKIDPTNDYILLLKKHRLDMYHDIPSNFSVVECNIKEFTFGEQIGLAKLLYSLRPDLVHFPFVQQPIFYFGKVVTTMQDLTTMRFVNPTKNYVKFRVMQAVYYVVNQIVMRKSEHIITPTEFVKQDVMKTLHYNKSAKFTATLESSDDLPKPAEPMQELINKNFIMYVGRHQPHKNLPRLLRAHELLLEKHPNLLLAIVGKPDKTTELLRAEVKHPDKVVFTGFVCDQQLRWMYEHTAVYVFPSLSEGFGLPPLEAMRHGAPVVSSNATCIPEVCGDAALYFNPLVISDMANKISSVVVDRNIRVKLVSKGKEQVTKFSWKRMAEQTLKIYEGVSR